MNRWTVEHIMGGAFFVMGNITLLFGDFYVGAVWTLLGCGLLLFSPSVDRYGRKHIEWTRRNLLAAFALLSAITLTAGLLIADIPL